MEKKICGTAFVFGNNIDTDQIFPGRYLAETRPQDIGRHAMKGADPAFIQTVVPGDILVAGTNFGCGSSREHAVITLKAAGIAAVLAESFGRIFYRNGINIGLPLLVIPGITAKTAQGHRLCVDIAAGNITNQTTGETIHGEKISDHMSIILDKGGIKNYVLAQHKI